MKIYKNKNPDNHWISQLFSRNEAEWHKKKASVAYTGCGAKPSNSNQWPFAKKANIQRHSHYTGASVPQVKQVCPPTPNTTDHTWHAQTFSVTGLLGLVWVHVNLLSRGQWESFFVANDHMHDYTTNKMQKSKHRHPCLHSSFGKEFEEGKLNYKKVIVIQ